MGVVYEAWDERLEEPRAVKCAKTGHHERLTPEVRNAQKISHENVCKIYDIHNAQTSAGEVPFIVMEFMDGETLAERLTQSPLSEEAALLVTRQICAGLSAAHSHGVVHGDIKANNVILTKAADGSTRAVITDFGMAREREPKTGASDPAGGTRGYMAPELLKGEKATVASDVYALGVLLHEVATGRKPDNADTTLTLPFGDGQKRPRFERLSRKIRTALSRSDAVPLKWGSILERCPTEDPAARYASAAEVTKAFDPKPPVPAWLPIAAASALLAAIVAWSWLTGPKESIRLAMLPFSYSSDGAPAVNDLFREASANLAKVTGGKRARYSTISLADIQRAGVTTPEKAQAKFGATHVLSGALFKEKEHLVLQAVVTDTRTQTSLQDWRIEYEPAQVRYIPVTLAGIATASLHLPPLQVAAINSAARADYDAGSALLRRTSTYDAAIAAFERSVAADPNSALAYAGLTEAQWAKQSLTAITKNNEWLDRAKQNISQAQRRNPDVARVWMVAAILDVSNSYFEKGESEYLRAIELDPNYSDAYRNLGRIYEITGQREKALAAFKRAVTTDRQFYRTYQYLGGFYLRQYRYSDAVEPLRQAVALAPDEYEPQYYLADAYQLLGRYREAEGALRAALAIRRT
jgi:tetratricopeptide (TPR) repeat protein